MRDRTSGNFLHQQAAEIIELTDAQAVWTDLIKCEQAHTINVRQAASQKHHISLRGMPRLQRITNPAQVPLVLHLDLHAHTQAHTETPAAGIHIEGPINHVDLSWQGGDYLHQRSRKTDYKKLLLVPFAALENSRVAAQLQQLCDKSLLIIYQASNQANSQASTHTQSPQTELTLDFRGDIVLHSLSDITTLNLKHNNFVQAMNCRKLTYINGIAEQVRLNDCGENQLIFTGRQYLVDLTDCCIHSLTIEDTELLGVRGRSYLDRADIPTHTKMTTISMINGDVFPRINEGTLQQLLTQFENASAQQRDQAIRQLLGTVANAAHSKAQLYGIRLLADLAKREPQYHPQILQARDDMLKTASNNMPSQHTHREWRFPTDLELEGWQADVQLWCELTQTHPKEVDKYYRHQLLRLAHKPRVYYALVTVLLQNQQYQRLVLVLRNIDAEQRFNRVRRMELNSEVVLKAMRRLVLSIDKWPDRLARTVISHLFKRCDANDLPAIGNKLLSQAPQLTRQIALRMASQRSECRTTFMALALGAVPAAHSSEAHTSKKKEQPTQERSHV